MHGPPLSGTAGDPARLFRSCLDMIAAGTSHNPEVNEERKLDHHVPPRSPIVTGAIASMIDPSGISSIDQPGKYSALPRL